MDASDRTRFRKEVAIYGNISTIVQAKQSGGTTSINQQYNVSAVKTLNGLAVSSFVTFKTYESRQDYKSGQVDTGNC
jgi:hypothetical protein